MVRRNGAFLRWWEQPVLTITAGAPTNGKSTALPARTEPSRPSPRTAGLDTIHPLAPRFIKPFPRWKRAMDVAGALAGLVLLAPVMFAVGLAIRLDSPGPAIFRQRRGGLGGRPFTMLKFRSMVTDADHRKTQLLALNERSGPAFKMRHDPRVTRVGRFIRKASLDELPQLFNVLRGDMSLVGPRPLPLDEEQGYARWQRHRLQVRPGITCIWQVTSRDDRDFDRWMRLDMSYVMHCTPVEDLKLILMTLLSVALRRGAS